jgi:hypothetical protein
MSDPHQGSGEHPVGRYGTSPDEAPAPARGSVPAEPSRDSAHPVPMQRSGPVDSGTSADQDAPEPATVLGASLAGAARKAGLGDLMESERPTGAALLKAMGGVRGIIEAIVPGLLFLLVFTFTQSLPWALGVSVGVAALLTLLRIIGKTPVTAALGGLVGVVLSAVLALITNKPEDNFVLGFFTNGAYGAVLLVSVLVGWPLIGLAVGFLMNDGIAWRQDRVKRRALRWLTLAWAGLFILRLAVQLPLYFSGNVEWLGSTKLLMGIPLYAPLLVVSWLVVRGLYRAPETDAAASDTPDRPGSPT